MKLASTIDAQQFDKFEPLLADVRLDKHSALLGSFMINFRRITMLYMAMKVHNRQQIQVLVFLSLNFVSFTYVLLVRPFDKAHLNFLNIFNEGIGLLVAYFLLPL